MTPAAAPAVSPPTRGGAGEVAGASARISPALLFPQERIARAPLKGWAALLRARLHRVISEGERPREVAREVARVANNAALIAVHHGMRDAALALTHAQIGWHPRYGRRCDDTAISAHAVQPWVNLGRLEAIDGAWARALARFTCLGEYGSPAGMVLGEVRVDDGGWAAVFSTRGEFKGFLENVRVLDTLKALLLNRRFAEAVEYVSAGRGTWSSRIHPFADEVLIICGCARGEPEEAVHRARQTSRETTGWARVVFRVREAEALACAGAWDRAAEVLRPLAAVVGRAAPERRQELQNLYVCLRLSQVCRDCGLEETAAAMARYVVQGARVAEDEVFQIEALRILAVLAPAPEQEAWGDELARLEENTLHARYRRGGPAPPHPTVERLFAELGEVLAA